jgi:acyl-[acyl-carrier-protein] desaturase
VFDRTDFGGRGEQLREDLDAFLTDLQTKAERFEEARDRALARQARRDEHAGASA